MLSHPHILNLIGSAMALIAATGAFVTHVLSSPARRLWFPMPLYVRLPILVIGVHGVWRGVHWGWLYFHLGQPGHANWWATGTWALLAWYFTVVAYSITRRRLAPGTWKSFQAIGQAEIRKRAARRASGGGKS